MGSQTFWAIASLLEDKAVPCPADCCGVYWMRSGTKPSSPHRKRTAVLMAQ